MRSDFSLKKGRNINQKKGADSFLLLGNCVWLSVRMHIGERLNEGPRLQ